MERGLSSNQSIRNMSSFPTKPATTKSVSSKQQQYHEYLEQMHKNIHDEKMRRFLKHT